MPITPQPMGRFHRNLNPSLGPDPSSTHRPIGVAYPPPPQFVSATNQKTNYRAHTRCRRVHALPPKNVTLICRFVPVVTVKFFASHADWGRYHAPSKILPNTSLVSKLLQIPLPQLRFVRFFPFYCTIPTYTSRTP